MPSTERAVWTISGRPTVWPAAVSSLTECGGEDGDLVDGGDTLAVEGFEELAGAVGLVAEAADQGCELGEAHAEEGLRRVGGGGGHLRSV